MHPTLQRLIFRNYLQGRGETSKKQPVQSSTILMTTHSPHVASVTPLTDFVLLRLNKKGDGTEVVSTVSIGLEEDDIADLERYLDVNRGELMFARGLILVEGDAEKFVLPVLARNLGYDLDELGISICSIAGTNFYPYLVLLGPKGLNIPLSALTDYDPRKPKSDGTPRTPLGPERVVNQMMEPLIGKKTWNAADFNEILKIAPRNGVFMSTHTFEVDLFKCGLASTFVEAMNGLNVSKQIQQRMKASAVDIGALDVDAFLRDIEAVGKGRFAQRLASVLLGCGIKKCPKYVLEGIKFVAERCRRG